jgi:transcriptional regulator with XRE-family HTH domain
MRKQYADDSLVVRVGLRIRKLRTERDLTLRELGKLSGVQPFHIMAIELGKLAANVKTLLAIANALDVKPLDILNHDIDDDLCHLIELMRTQPGTIQQIRQYVEPRVVN